MQGQTIGTATISSVDPVAACVRDGFAVIDGLVGPVELPALRREAADVLAEQRPSTCERENNRLVALRWNDRLVTRLLTPPRLDAIARASGGDDLRWISGYVSSKDPGMGPLWWQQDWWCWQHPVSRQPRPTQAAVLVYLIDMHQDNGALRVLPGSHHQRTALHDSLPGSVDRGSADLPSNHPVIRDHPGQVTVAVHAGDAVLLDYRLLHGTHANHSRHRRDAVLLNFTPSWQTTPRDIQGHLIRNAAQPTDGERRAGLPGLTASVLPSFEGPGRDLRVTRVPPQDFAVQR